MEGNKKNDLNYYISFVIGAFRGGGGGGIDLTPKGIAVNSMAPLLIDQQV